MKRLFIVLVVVVLFAAPASALMSFGDIPNAPGMEYDDLKFEGRYVNITIENHNSHPVRFIASVVFASLRDEVLGETFLDFTLIPPGGEVTTKALIINGHPDKVKKASKIFWVIYR